MDWQSYRRYRAGIGVVAATALAALANPAAAAKGLAPFAAASPTANATLPTTARVHSATAPTLGPSWMRPDKKPGRLLYISDSIAWNVEAFTYPGGQLSGTISEVKQAAGECADAKGHVYVTAESEDAVVEYAHGGSDPIAILKHNGYVPVACSVDPTTGNLAVAEIESGLSENPGPGAVFVYANGRGKPQKFRASNLISYYFLGYDNVGNLFVDGSTGRAGVNVRFAYAELPHGQTTMTPITLTGGTVVFPGNVQWDGTHMTVGDQSTNRIYQTQGSAIIGSTQLSGSSDVTGYFIDGFTVICPDAGNGTVEYYEYPAGGDPVGGLTGFKTPLGAVVST